MVALAEHFTGRISLNLLGCFSLKDAVVVAFERHGGPGEPLKPDGCGGGCSRGALSRPHFGGPGGCFILTDAAMAGLAEHCPGLSLADLEGCSNLTDAAVVALAEHCPGLTSV